MPPQKDLNNDQKFSLSSKVVGPSKSFSGNVFNGTDPDISTTKEALIEENKLEKRRCKKKAKSKEKSLKAKKNSAEKSFEDPSDSYAFRDSDVNMEDEEKNSKSLEVLGSKEEKKAGSQHSDYCPTPDKEKDLMKAITFEPAYRGAKKGKVKRYNLSTKTMLSKTMLSRTKGFKKPVMREQKGKKEEVRKCKLCDKEFTRQGLGGHMSRAHPGKSEEYKQKKATRNGRQEKLKLLRLAQDVYRKRIGQLTLKGTDMNRTKLNKLRDDIKKWLDAHPGQEYPY